MKITKLQLPDGTCVTIEGGDSAATANLLTNHYLRNVAGPVRNVPGGEDTNEEVLAIPALTFETFAQAEEKERARQAAASSRKEIATNHEECLALPALNFSQE